MTHGTIRDPERQDQFWIREQGTRIRLSFGFQC